MEKGFIMLEKALHTIALENSGENLYGEELENKTQEVLNFFLEELQFNDDEEDRIASRGRGIRDRRDSFKSSRARTTMATRRLGKR